MIFGHFSDICGLWYGPQISEKWPKTIRTTVPWLIKSLIEDNAYYTIVRSVIITNTKTRITSTVTTLINYLANNRH